MIRMTRVIALAATACLSSVVVLPSMADPNPIKAPNGLQVSIVPAGTINNDNVVPLTVKFRGGNIRVIELYVNGERLTRQLISTREGKGTVHFSIDPSLLAEGSHEVLVKAYEADGTCATSTSQINVAGAPSNALARFIYPKRNAEVQGVVPFQLKIDESISDPYVTFLLNNEFLSLVKQSNTNTYTYNWDSTKVANGSHIIGIDVMDGKTLQSVQKLTLKVNVKNVGGFTNIRPSTPAPTKATSAGGELTEMALEAAESALPEAKLAVPSVASSLFKTDFKKTSVFNARTARPESNYVAPTTKIAAPDIYPPKVVAPAPRVVPGLAAIAVEPTSLLPVVKPTFSITRHEFRTRRNGLIALRPSPNRFAAPGDAAVVPASLPGFAKPASKNFNVLFNNHIIKFDVEPRIENGIPLAPFRAIFEYSGGTVDWFNQNKVLRAKDSENNIELRIGEDTAKINDSILKLETAPFLDRGRTIIPISFLREGMNLKVEFDPQTGNLLIERK